jgi:hypothetical protein
MSRSLTGSDPGATAYADVRADRASALVSKRTAAVRDAVVDRDRSGCRARPEALFVLTPKPEPHDRKGGTGGADLGEEVKVEGPRPVFVGTIVE